MGISRNEFGFIYNILNDFIQESYGYIYTTNGEKISTRCKICGVNNPDTIIINPNDKNIPHLESMNSNDDDMLTHHYGKICNMITDDELIKTYITSVINKCPSDIKEALMDINTYQRLISDIYTIGLMNIMYIKYDYDNPIIKRYMIHFCEIYGDIKGKGDSKIFHGDSYHNNYDYSSFPFDDNLDPLHQLIEYSGIFDVQTKEYFSIRSAFRICFNEIINSEVLTDAEYEKIFTRFIHYAVFYAASLNVNDIIVKHLNSKIPSKNNKAFNKANRDSMYTYGIPTKKLFPMFTKQNVLDAICVFPYARSYDKPELAKRIYIRSQDFDIGTNDPIWNDIKPYLNEKEVDELMENKRVDKIQYYLDIAKAVSERGTCLRRKFGAVIVKNDGIVSTGYVGAPRGRKNCCDIGKCFRMENNVPSGQRYELCRSSHAEMNAIIAASKEEMEGAVLYLCGVENDGSITPNADCCSMCKRVIINSGIKYVIVATPDGSYKMTDVNDWIENDDSLYLHEGY